MTNRDEIEELKRRVKVLEEQITRIEQIKRKTNRSYPELIPFPYGKRLVPQRWPNYDDNWQWHSIITNPRTSNWRSQGGLD